MFSFRKSLISLAGIFVLAGGIAALIPLAGRGQESSKNPLTRDLRRSFYLTQTTHDGSQALTACAEGYHMASLWEIFDTSNLRYNTALGATRADSGAGPPAGASVSSTGWIRTGWQASSVETPGQANCNAWTSSDTSGFGTVVHLAPFWDSPAGRLDPWFAELGSCGAHASVWCVQD